MKDLLKQYIEKGYEPTFFVYEKKDDELFYRCNIPVGSYIPKYEKLELYLMRDWLEEKMDGQIIDVYRSMGGKWRYDYLTNCSFDSRIAALKSALEEAIKNV